MCGHVQACTYMWQQHGTWASQRSGTAACGNSTLVGSRTSKRAAADGSPPQATAPVPSPRVPAHAAAAHPRHTASGARLHWVGFMVHWRQGPSNRARFPADKPCRQMQAQPASASRPRSSPSITAAGTACSPSALNCLVPDGACAAANDAKRSWAEARTGGAGAAVLQPAAAAAAGSGGTGWAEAWSMDALAMACTPARRVAGTARLPVARSAAAFPLALSLNPNCGS